MLLCIRTYAILLSFHSLQFFVLEVHSTDTLLDLLIQNKLVPHSLTFFGLGRPPTSASLTYRWWSKTGSLDACAQCHQSRVLLLGTWSVIGKIFVEKDYTSGTTVCSLSPSACLQISTGTHHSLTGESM